MLTSLWNELFAYSRVMNAEEDPAQIPPNTHFPTVYNHAPFLPLLSEYPSVSLATARRSGAVQSFKLQSG